MKKTEGQNHLKLVLLCRSCLFIHSFLQLGDLSYYSAFKCLVSWLLLHIQLIIKLRLKNYQDLLMCQISSGCCTITAAVLVASPS